MKWQVIYYDEKVKTGVFSWPDSLLARYLRIVDLIEKEGPNLGMPFTKAMGDGLFEIRVKGQEGIGRVFFCYVVNKRIVVLHGFVKKTQKTPKKELKLAQKRLIEVLNHEL